MVLLKPSLKFSALLALVPLTPFASALPRARQADTYDYIVVGGGTAGSVVASRLSEDPRVTVLLVEGGPTNEGVTNAIIPYIYNRLFNSPYNWNWTTVPQAGLNGRTTAYLRGHILGGSSSINGMTVNRAPAADWDQIAAFTRDSSFSWNSILPLIRRNEQFDRPPSDERWANAYVPEVHGYDAGSNIGTSLVEDDSWITEPTFTGAQEIGMPVSRDVNGGDPMGVSWQQFAVKDGARSSAATGFLGPEVRRRRNLRIVLNAKVSRVLPANNRPPLRFNTVEWRDASGRVVTAIANREIVLSTGVLATPAILMRSGIGPRATLRAANITTLVDIPAVGQFMQDRTGVSVPFRVNSTGTEDDIDRNATYFNEQLAQWNRDRTGVLAQTGYRHMLFDRIPDNDPIFRNGFQDPSSGPSCPHYEIYPANRWAAGPMPATGNYVTLSTFVSASNVRGSVTINPADPNGQPLIDPRYMQSDWDKYVMRTAIRRAAEYMRAPAWQRWGATPAFDASILDDDAALDNFTASNSYGGVHGVGTARMGSRNSSPSEAVIGPDFRVKGVQGLRIADTSVFPFVINGHTMGATYVMAEKAAQVIRSGQ